jgi:phosphatidylglycerophosphate synthase
MNAGTYVTLVVAAIVLLTMPVFAVVSRNRSIDADVARRPTTFILGYWVRDWLMWLIAPMERRFVAWELSPDLFNYLGAVLGLGAGVAYATGDLDLGGWLVLFGGLADIIDGRLARARGIASDYGEFLDSMLDRFAETFAFAGLAYFFAALPWAVTATLLALGGSMLVSYARAKGEGVGVDCRGGIMQRAERLVLLALASLLDGVVTTAAGWRPGTLLIFAIVLIAIGSLGTAVYRTVYVARRVKKAVASRE